MYTNIFVFLIFIGSLSSWIRAELSGEVCPGCGHLWHSLISKMEMMCLLIIFHPISSKNWMSFIGIISKFALRCTFEISWIFTKFIMSCYLIKSILVAECFIHTIIDWVSLFLKRFLLLSSEVLTPTSRVIPMARFKFVFIFFCHLNSLEWISCGKLIAIVGGVSSI